MFLLIAFRTSPTFPPSCLLSGWIRSLRRSFTPSLHQCFGRALNQHSLIPIDFCPPCKIFFPTFFQIKLSCVTSRLVDAGKRAMRKSSVNPAQDIWFSGWEKKLIIRHPSAPPKTKYLMCYFDSELAPSWWWRKRMQFGGEWSMLVMRSKHAWNEHAIFFFCLFFYFLKHLFHPVECRTDTLGAPRGIMTPDDPSIDQMIGQRMSWLDS